MFRLPLRMTLRDWRAGELRFLLAALTLSVAALSAVNFFVDRMGAAFNRDAHQTLAADLRLESEQPLAPAWRAEALRRGLRAADTVTLLSMAVAGEGEQTNSLLVALKAVGEGYPLRGKLTLARGDAAVATAALPTPGTVWVDQALMLNLNLRVGARLRIGDSELLVAERIASEPDAGAAFMNLAPRVMMARADLDAAHLLQSHALATHRLLLAGEPAAVAGYAQWAKARSATPQGGGVQIESFESRRSEANTMLEQAQQFLSLVGLLSALLAAVAVAMAARRFMLRHVDACAMLRCLGMAQGQVLRLYLIEFLLVALVGSVAGVLCGFAAHFVLIEWLGKLVAADLPAAGWRPALQGLATGLVLLVGFALPPLLQLRNTSHVRLLRGDAGAPKALSLAGYGLGLGMFTALLLWQTGDLMLGLAGAAAFLLGGLLFGLLAWLALRLLRRARPLLRQPAWRFAITDMLRRPAATVAQIVALALGLTALLLLTVVRADLLASWRLATPAGAANHFVVNIQPEQKDAVEARMRAVGQAELRASTRGRLTLINGRASVDAGTDAEAKESLEREFDIGQSSLLDAASSITAGAWYGQRHGEVSVEAKTAERLKLKLGDQLTFDVAGQDLTLRVSSLRKVDWRQRRASMIFDTHPDSLAGLPLSYAAALHVPPQDKRFAHQLARDFPNLSVFDVAAFIEQMRRTLDQVSHAVEFLFLFTLASGLMVLYAALAGAQDQRSRQAALLRALGATRRQLARAQWVEHGLTGALAGLLAAAGASAASWALARYAFHLEWTWSAPLWLGGLLAGAVCAMAGGWFGLRHVLKLPPLHSLRQA
ncbi:MAG: FtsX-like permease family protein [Pseudomonadota bacterium]